MDKGITVRQLRDMCEVLISEGYGDKHILISDDDEGNGFHTLFYAFTFVDQESVPVAELFHDNNDPNEVILLG